MLYREINLKLKLAYTLAYGIACGYFIIFKCERVLCLGRSFIQIAQVHKYRVLGYLQFIFRPIKLNDEYDGFADSAEGRIRLLYARTLVQRLRVAAAGYGYYICELASFSTQIKQQNRKHKYCDSAHRNAKYRHKRTHSTHIQPSDIPLTICDQTAFHYRAVPLYTQFHRTATIFYIAVFKLKRTHIYIYIYREILL